MVVTSARFDFRSDSSNLKKFVDTLERAGIAANPRNIAIGVAIAAVVLWLMIVLVMRPSPVIAILLFPFCAALAAGGFWMYVKFQLRKRLDQFVQQLELALRLIASGVRIGLGLRQALTIVIEEMPDPARHEYMRVVGQTNIGVTVYDALDNLAVRMPGNETLMMARAIRIQSQTGGDLGKILEHLANTIKERRLFTNAGHISLVIVGVLETLGVLMLMKMLKVDV